jgi:hypothetical protein
LPTVNALLHEEVAERILIQPFLVGHLLGVLRAEGSTGADPGDNSTFYQPEHDKLESRRGGKGRHSWIAEPGRYTGVTGSLGTSQIGSYVSTE